MHQRQWKIVGQKVLNYIYMSQYTSSATAMFLEKLIETAHGTSLPEQLRAQMMEDLNVRLYQHLQLSYLQVLSDESTRAYEELLVNDASQEDVEKFLAEHIPRITELTAEALLEFRDVYLHAYK